MDNQVSATLKYALLSDKKMNLIAATEALADLEFLPKKGARTLHKLIKSAVANASAKWLPVDQLVIDRIEVWRWPKIKRIRFTSRSRISHYEKYRCYVKVVLAVK